MIDKISRLISLCLILAIWLTSIHKLLIWLLGGLGMAISVIIMILITKAVAEMDVM